MSGRNRISMVGILVSMAALTLALVAFLPTVSRAATLTTFTMLTGGAPEEGSRGVLDKDVIDFMGPGGGVENDEFTPTPSHLDVEVPMAAAGTAKNLHVTIECNDSLDLTALEDFRFEVLKNGSTTGIECKISGPTSGPANSGSCKDNTHTAAFSQGDGLSIEISPEPIGTGPDDDECRVVGWSLLYGVAALVKQ